MIIGQKIIQRFHSFYNTTSNDNCWIWKGSKDSNGHYGRFSINKKYYRAHRIAYLLKNHTLDDRQIHHKCENTLCVNPAHMELVTQQEHNNLTKNGLTLLNRSKTHCPYGHELKFKYTLHTGDILRQCGECRNAQKTYRRRKTLGLNVPNSWRDLLQLQSNDKRK